jgi:DNA polymerase-3 subunit delta
MLKIFSGSDTFESYKAAKELLAKLEKQTSYEVRYVDGESIRSADDLSRSLESNTLFSNGLIIFAKRALNGSIAKYLAENIEVFSDNVGNPKYLIMWEDGKIDGRIKGIQELKKLGAIEEYSLLKDYEVTKWAREETKRRRLKLSPDLVEKLSSYASYDKWVISSTLGKLEVYQDLKKDREAISSEDMDMLCANTDGGDIWVFLDRATSGKKYEALIELDKLMRFNDNGQYLLAMLAREINILARLRYALDHGLDESVLKLHPFVVKKAKENVKKYSWDSIKRLSQALVRLDVAIKEGRLDDMTGITLFVLSMPGK